MHTSKNNADVSTFIAPGKLILIGEYAVLEKAPALVAGIAVYAKAKIKRSNKSYSTFFSTNIKEKRLNFKVAPNQVRFLHEKSENSFPFIRSLLLEICHLDIKINSHFELELDTREFYTKSGIKYGLGSSAAATVAAACALSHFMQVESDQLLLLNLATRAHMSAQEMVGSGIDLAASVYGGVICFQRSQSDKFPLSLNFPDKLNWMPVWTGKSASTSDLVKRIMKFKSENSADYTRIMEQMHLISEKACTDFAGNQIDSFLSGITEYFFLMDELSTVSGIPIISEEHKYLAKIATKAGAYYKPSGAGLGDFGLVFFESDKAKQRFISATADAAFKIMPLHIDFEGARQQSN